MGCVNIKYSSEHIFLKHFLNEFNKQKNINFDKIEKKYQLTLNNDIHYKIYELFICNYSKNIDAIKLYMNYYNNKDIFINL